MLMSPNSLDPTPHQTKGLCYAMFCCATLHHKAIVVPEPKINTVNNKPWITEDRPNANRKHSLRSKIAMRKMNTSERLQHATCENSRAPHKFVLNAGVPQVADSRNVTESYGQSR